VDSEKFSPIKNKKSSGNKTNLYDIDNFIVHSTNSKVLDRQESLQIFVPKFKELDRDYWHNNSNEILLIKNELEEDISDDIYNSFHNEFERREIEYRINLNKKKKDRKSSTLISSTLLQKQQSGLNLNNNSNEIIKNDEKTSINDENNINSTQKSNLKVLIKYGNNNKLIII